MNYPEQIEIEVRTAFHKFLEILFRERNMEKVFEMMGEEISVVGTAPDEIAFQKNSAKELFVRDILQIPNRIDYVIDTINIQILAETIGLVNAVFSIQTEIGNSQLEMKGIRLSTIFKKTGIDWYIVHEHISLPILDIADGESYPLEELKRKNLWLENKIEENKKDLFAINLKLEEDIAQRKQTEKELRESNELFSLFMKHSPIYSFIKQVSPHESKVLKASENFKEMIGIGGNELIGKNMYQLFPAELAEKMTNDDWYVFSNGKPVVLQEDMNGRNYTSIKFPISNNGNNLLAGYVIDITDRKRAELEIKRKNIELQQLNATKDKFFSIIAHDLKNPFQSIVGLSDLLAVQVKEKSYDEVEEYANMILNSSRQALALLNNLMEWSRSQIGRMDYYPGICDFQSIMSETIPLLEDMARQKSITIMKNYRPDETIFADKAMISTVLRNLITNAVKFSLPGGTISITAERLPSEFTVSVRDNGVGISKDNLNKLFDLNGNLTTRGTKNEQGTGLGLILCKEFIDKHKGKIWVNSEEGKGSVFSFSIPVII